MEGNLASDTVTIADLAISCQYFAEAYHEDDTNFANATLDGILGLNLRSLSGKATPFANMLSQGLVKRPVFSFFLNRDPKGKIGGEIVFGGSNPKYHQGEFHYAPLNEYSAETGHWAFQMDGIQIEKASGEGNVVFNGCILWRDSGF